MRAAASELLEVSAASELLEMSTAAACDLEASLHGKQLSGLSTADPQGSISKHVRKATHTELRRRTARWAAGNRRGDGSEQTESETREWQRSETARAHVERSEVSDQKNSEGCCLELPRRCHPHSAVLDRACSSLAQC